MECTIGFPPSAKSWLNNTPYPEVQNYARKYFQKGAQDLSESEIKHLYQKEFVEKQASYIWWNALPSSEKYNFAGCNFAGAIDLANFELYEIDTIWMEEVVKPWWDKLGVLAAAKLTQLYGVKGMVDSFTKKRIYFNELQKEAGEKNEEEIFLEAHGYSKTASPKVFKEMINLLNDYKKYLSI